MLWWQLACGFIFPPTLGLISQWCTSLWLSDKRVLAHEKIIVHKRRATAFGITASGTSLGGIVFPLLVRFILPTHGFKWTVRILGFIVAFALLIGFVVSSLIHFVTKKFDLLTSFRRQGHDFLLDPSRNSSTRMLLRTNVCSCTAQDHSLRSSGCIRVRLFLCQNGGLTVVQSSHSSLCPL